MIVVYYLCWLYSIIITTLIELYEIFINSIPKDFNELYNLLCIEIWYSLTIISSFILIANTMIIICLNTHVTSDITSEMDNTIEAVDDYFISMVGKYFYKEGIFINFVINNQMLHPYRFSLISL